MTTFGAGGAASFFARPGDRAQLAETLGLANEMKIPVLVLGGGSNLLIADAGVEAMVIKLSGAGEFGEIQVEDAATGRWRVGAAAGLQNLVMTAARAGRTGMECMAGIPGLVGGAAAMNAGGADGGIGEYIKSADLFEFSGGQHLLVPPELAFSYRNSTVRGRLAVAFDMVFPDADEPETLLARVREYRERKAATQPLGLRSAGCVFKNPAGASAGALLDAAGCKGMGEGNARVSERHANFIVAVGPVCARDIATLAVRMRETVWENAGVRLEPEIALWGNEPLFAALCAE